MAAEIEKLENIRLDYESYIVSNLCGSIWCALENGNHGKVIESVNQYKSIAKSITRYQYVDAFMDDCLVLAQDRVNPKQLIVKLYDRNSKPEYLAWMAGVWEFAYTEGLIDEWLQRLCDVASERHDKEKITALLKAVGLGTMTMAQVKEQIQNDMPIIIGQQNVLRIVDMKTHAEDELYAIDKLIPAGGTAVVSGEPGCGKSMLMLDLALRYATPTEIDKRIKWLGQFGCHGGKVIIIETENPKRVIARRLETLHATDNMQLVFITPAVIGRSKIDLLDESCQAQLSRIIRSVDINENDMIIVDSLRRTLGGDENSSTDIASYFSVVNGWEGTKIVVHHLRKVSQHGDNSISSRLRGSGDIEGACDVHLSFKTEGTSEGKITTVIPGKVRNQDINTFQIIWNQKFADHLSFTIADRDQASYVIATPVLRAIKAAAGRGVDMIELQQKAGMSRDAITSAINVLLGDNAEGQAFIAMEKKGRKTYYYFKN